MADPENSTERRKIRVKTRVPGGRGLENVPKLTRGKVAAVLLLAAAAGIFFGLLLGRGIRKIIRVRREQGEIVQSLAGPRAATPEPAAPASIPDPARQPAAE